MTPQEEERAAIVAWLRTKPWWREISPNHCTAWKPSDLAIAIESGDHLTTEGKEE